MSCCVGRRTALAAKKKHARMQTRVRTVTFTMGVRTLLLGTEGTDAIICSGMTSALFGMCALVCRTGGCVDESEAFAVLVAALKGAMVVCAVLAAGCLAGKVAALLSGPQH